MEKIEKDKIERAQQPCLYRRDNSTVKSLPQDSIMPLYFEIDTFEALSMWSSSEAHSM